MLKKIWVWLALSFPIVALLIWTADLQLRLNHASRVYIAVEGYDPRSLISGQYLQLRINWDDTDCEQFHGHKCPVEFFESSYQFYIPEETAVQLEKLINQKRPQMQLEFVLNHGSPLIRNLYIDNISWSKWYKWQMKNADK